MDDTYFVNAGLTNGTYNSGPTATYGAEVNAGITYGPTSVDCSFSVDYTDEYLVAEGATSIDVETSITCIAESNLDIFNNDAGGGRCLVSASCSGTSTFDVKRVCVE